MEPGGCGEQGDACGHQEDLQSDEADRRRHTVNIYENVTPRPNRHDLMIEMEMDPEALPVYDASATHQEWKARYGKYIQTKTIFDYE